MLGFLDSDALKSGLKLLNTAQPAVAPMTAMAVTIGKMFARRNENIRIHNVELGLDFEPSKTGYRLGLGSYVVVQLPAHHTEFEWNDYALDTEKQRYVLRKEQYQEIPYNFFVFRVTPYDEG
jgi:hypothetical protein